MWCKLDLSESEGGEEEEVEGSEQRLQQVSGLPRGEKEINIPRIFEGWIWGPAGPVGSNPSLISSLRLRSGLLQV